MNSKAEYLNCVANCDGNSSELSRYWSICESILNSFYDWTNLGSFQYIYIYLPNSVNSQIQGKASLVINIQNVINWEYLKLILYWNFPYQRDVACSNY